MKHTLEEIKQMLSEISPWPWDKKSVYSPYFATEGGYRIKTPDGNLVAETGEGSHTIEEIRVDAYFITAAPQIISDFVQECERLRNYVREDSLGKRALVAEGKRLSAQVQDLITENLKLRAQLFDLDKSLEAKRL